MPSRNRYVIWDDYENMWVGLREPDEEKLFSYIYEWANAQKFDTVAQAVVMARFFGLHQFMICHATMEKVYFMNNTPYGTSWRLIDHPMQKLASTITNEYEEEE